MIFNYLLYLENGLFLVRSSSDRALSLGQKCSMQRVSGGQRFTVLAPRYSVQYSRYSGLGLFCSISKFSASCR